MLERCLARAPRAWEDFVDRYLGLVVHVINHTAQARSIRLTPEDRDDLCADVFLAVIQDDFAVLRHFRGLSSLATYLTVVARRIVVRQLMNQKSARLAPAAAHATSDSNSNGAEALLADREQVTRLMDQLDAGEAELVRLYHLEGKSYQEISAAVGMPENSVGPLLSRARKKLRQLGLDANPATS
ncbi:MAG: sigma-70 family RNA polymerase sigma factor [Planctomycetaceae bacterium]|nr:sigma-70 family RNA polymerase sigma factor [Planctomycetaceae bacterium]